MRNKYLLVSPLLIMILLLGSSLQSNAQQYNAIHFSGCSVGAQLVEFEYEIPYDGVVEIQLFDSAGKLVYFNRYVREEGQGSIPVRRTGFKSGEAYSYMLKYKNSKISGEVPL